MNVFKVVRIINKYYVVINAGAAYVSKGGCLEIYTPGIVEIFDPDSNESLGMLDYVKARIYVEDVFEKICVCKNSEVKEEKRYNFAAINFDETIEVTKELNVNDEDISGGYANIDKKIKVGDLVRNPLG